MTPGRSALVLDTNIVSYLFREDALADPYRPHLRDRAAVLSFQTVAELELWPLVKGWGARRRARLAAFVAGYSVFPYDPALGRRWAVVTLGARRAGRPINSADAWIAATALELGVPLVTHNAADFAGVTDLELVVEQG